MATRKRHIPEQVVRKSTEADRLLADGKDVAEVCRLLQVTEATYYRVMKYGPTVSFVGSVATIIVAVAQPLLLHTSVVIAFEFVRLAQAQPAVAFAARFAWAEFEGHQCLYVDGCGEFGHGWCRHRCQPYRGGP